jgi:hypothetical protein
MHRARELWLLWLPLLVSAAPVARAAAVPSLYAAVVPGADAQRSAQLAMRAVLVRLVGSRDAADDPALAGLIEQAPRYVQAERGTTRGATQVMFDPAAVRAAVAAAGRGVWDPDRPLVWVLLPARNGAALEELRAQLSAAALVRGLPIALVSADRSTAAGAAHADAAAVLAAARREGAGAALIGEQGPGGETGPLQWTLVAANADGHWSGGAEAAIDGATDALVRAARAVASAPVGEFDCSVAGVNDLQAFTAVLDALAQTPGVSDLAVRAIDGDRLTVHFRARGAGAALARTLGTGRLHADGAGGDGGDGRLQLRYTGGP